MHKIRLITVGKIKTSWIAEGCEFFINRLGHQCDLDIHILLPGTKEEENERLLKVLEKEKGTIVLLDETGKQYSSVQFADWMSGFRDRGEAMTFVLGGAYGFDDVVRSKAKHTVALSAMTFPHELCQLIFLEQLYRAHSIAAGSGYHH